MLSALFWLCLLELKKLSKFSVIILKSSESLAESRSGEVKIYLYLIKLFVEIELINKLFELFSIYDFLFEDATTLFDDY